MREFTRNTFGELFSATIWRGLDVEEAKGGRRGLSILLQVIRGKVEPSATIHTDDFRSYNSIVHMCNRKHCRVRRGRDEYVHGSSCTDGIEDFWSIAKTWFVKFKGMSCSTFYLHLEGV
jgi:transposase-like protein